MSVYLPEIFQTKSAGEVWLRSAVPKDAPKVLDFMIKAAYESDRFFLSTREEFERMTVAEQEKWIESHMVNACGLVLIAEQNERVIALMNCMNGLRKRNAHLASLGISILKEFHRQGLGLKMMDTLAKWARQTGKIEKLELQVNPSNVAAIALYKKLGYFNEVLLEKQIKLGPGEYQDSLHMGLWL